MTDNELIFALENKVNGSDYHNFEDYELLDLINRQKAEIEKLKGSTIVSNIMESQRIKREAKAEAYKEFAERLNEEAQIADCFDSYNMVVGTHFIDNLLKELVC